METSAKTRAFFPLVITFFFWGSIYVAAKMISDDLPPQLLACMRCTVAMLPLLWLARGHLGTRIAPEDRKYFFLIGLLGYFMTVSLVQLGISLTGASMAALINALTPVSVTVMAALLLKEKITPLKCLCLVLALAGTVVVSSSAGSESDVIGIAAVLLSVLSWGAASVFMRRLTSKYPAILVTTYSMAVSLLFHIPAGIATAMTSPFRLSVKCVLVVLYLGFVGSGFAQYTWTRCLAILPASTCSLFYPLQAVFSALLGAVLLNETLPATFFWGLLLVSADVAICTWEMKRQTGK